MVWTSSKWGKIWLSSYNWPWGSRSIIPKNNRDLNQGVLHLWSKFGDPSLNGRWVIVQTSSWLIHTHTPTHRPTYASDDNTRRPKLASGNKMCIQLSSKVLGYQQFNSQSNAQWKKCQMTWTIWFGDYIDTLWWNDIYRFPTPFGWWNSWTFPGFFQDLILFFKDPPGLKQQLTRINILSQVSLLLHKQGKQWFNGTYQEILMNNISEICVNNIQVSH